MAFETRKQFVKHNLSDEPLNRAKKEYEDELEDETRERVYNSDEDDYVLRPKDLRSSFANNTMDIFKTKTETEMYKTTFINEHQRQNIKNIITADIECCVTNVSTSTSK